MERRKDQAKLIETRAEDQCRGDGSHSLEKG